MFVENEMTISARGLEVLADLTIHKPALYTALDFSKCESSFRYCQRKRLMSHLGISIRVNGGSEVSKEVLHMRLKVAES